MSALAKIVPESVQFEGVDVSSSLFRREQAANVHFTIASVTQLPQPWSERYDLVNQRLLMAALLATEWPIAVSEIFRVMKHGGTAQFLEFYHTIPLSPNLVASRKFDRIIDALYEENGLMRDCAAQISKMLAYAGFVDIKVDKRTVSTGRAGGKIGAMCTASIIGAVRNMKEPVMRAEGLGVVQSENEFDEVMDETFKEWQTVGVQCVFYVTTGRKP